MPALPRANLKAHGPNRKTLLVLPRRVIRFLSRLLLVIGTYAIVCPVAVQIGA
jgi:hypothetical protein